MLPFLPKSFQAQNITTLFIVTLSIGAVIFLLVTTLVIVAMVRFRARPGQPEPRPVFGNRSLELTWTIVPGIILVVILVLEFGTMQSADPPSAANLQPDLVITGHQWWWQVDYPKLGVHTANEIHLPVGQRFLAEMRSADVIHSFWVPQIARKLDLTPGAPVRMYLEADQPGTYSGTCVEYCGAEHAWMRVSVIAESPSDFNAWVQQLAAVPPATGSGDAAAGAQLFQQLTCANCHAIAGTPATKTFGPDLTNLATRQTLAGGVLANNPANLASWIANPQAAKPGALMPPFSLTPDQIRQIVAYLETLK